MKQMNKSLLAVALLGMIPGCSCGTNTTNKKDSMTRTTTPSKLQYEIIKPADESARSPKAGDMVFVHYTGWIADENGNPIMSRKFDSSVDRGEPFNFKIGAGYVIRGWDEGVMMMKVGEKRRLIIPGELGYGMRGYPPIIPGNATLVFDVELLDIK
jgi:FKBP-type peptidyl-prolyl cis-trans isomerase